MGLSWPLTGRSEEMRAVEAAIGTPRVPGILIGGSAGVGKSRLAREALTAAMARGCNGRWVAGTVAARSLPLGAFTAWIQPEATDGVHLVRGVIDSLATASGGAAVVAVDDVHLLDDLSAFVVAQIVGRGVAKVILTLRDDERPSAAVQEIWRGSGCERLDLQPLTLGETAELLAGTLDGTVDADAVQRLWTLAGGNALYLRHLVEREVSDGRLISDGRCWRWIGEPVVAPDLIELVESRIGELPVPVSEVIDALAVGEPIDLAALRRITGQEAVEGADDRGLIRLDPVVGRPDLEVRIAHPLYGEVRRCRAAPTRLRRLRGLVAAELGASEERDDLRVLVRRATLSVDSDLAPDPDLLVRAARGAVWLGDPSLADRLAQLGIAAGAGSEARFVRGHALSWLSRGEEADAVLADIDVGDLTEDDRARLAFLRASNTLWVLADPARAKDLIDGTVCTTPVARSYVDAFLAVYWFAMDQPDLAMKASSCLALEELPAVVDAEIAWALAAIAADAGRMGDAVAVADAGHAVAVRSLDAPEMLFNIADAHVGALLLAGRVRDAVDVAERVRQRAVDLPGAAHVLGAAVTGRAALGAGRLDDACALLEQAAAAFAASGYAMGWGYRYQFPRSIALAMRGRADEAAAGMAALDDVQRPFRSLDHERSLALAWVAASQGAVSEGIRMLLSAAERSRAKGQFAAEVMCLQTATQFGYRDGGPRLRELETIVEGPRVGLAASFAEMLHVDDPAGLARVSAGFEGIGDLVAAVDAAAQAAVAHRRRGQRGSALGCSTRADGLARRCGGITTPASCLAVAELPLSGREREIVTLIAEGLSNRAVAERLTLSVRTVESHLYRAMSRTGTTNREELAGLLGRRDRDPS